MSEKLYKFTFKKQHRGTWDRVSDAFDIKYNKIEVGYVQETTDNKWKISLQSPASEVALNKNPNCPWMWISVKQQFGTHEEARAWLNENRETVLGMLYFDEKSE